MNWFVRSTSLGCALIFICYGVYFFSGLSSAQQDWQRLVSHLSPADRVDNKALRKGVVKHFFYSDGQVRSSFDIQARDSTLIVHITDQGMDLFEELEGVVGSFWDQGHDKAYTVFMPRALFDYPKKTLFGYQAQLQEFDATTSKLLGRGSFEEIECLLKADPQLKLRKIHAQLHDN